MERKIGETFEFKGKKLQVKKSESVSCYGCFFAGQCGPLRKEVAGECQFEFRTDKNEVIFVEITAEQQTEHQQKLNLCEILKHCPNGELFWSPLLGDVKLYDIDEEAKTIDVTTKDLATWEINADGTITIDDITSEVIMLYPSREQRDWTKVKYEKKKERFDPKTLKAFDRVLVKSIIGSWICDNFSHIDCNGNFICIGHFFVRTIPYNDETKHLVGTKDEAPEFYRYWED